MVRCVARTNPEHLRWRSALLKQENEIRVFRDDDDISLLRGLEDLSIRGRYEAEVLHMNRLYLVLISEPARQRRRQLGVNPNCRSWPIRIGVAGNHTAAYAARIGWSSCRAA